MTHSCADITDYAETARSFLTDAFLEAMKLGFDRVAVSTLTELVRLSCVYRNTRSVAVGWESAVKECVAHALNDSGLDHSALPFPTQNDLVQAMLESYFTGERARFSQLALAVTAGVSPSANR